MYPLRGRLTYGLDFYGERLGAANTHGKEIRLFWKRSSLEPIQDSRRRRKGGADMALARPLDCTYHESVKGDPAPSRIMGTR
jgi:hypothetical protein